MDNARKIAVEVVDAILSKGAYSNIVLNSKLNKADLEDRDKSLVTEIVYGTIKYKYTIDKILSSYLKLGLNKMNSFTLNILRTSLYQMRFLTKIPEFAAVNEAVNIAKKHASLSDSKLVNGVLRNYLRNPEKIYYNQNDLVEKLCFEYSFEPWLVKMFIKQYGVEKCQLILAGLNSTPNVTVRVNSLKISYEEAMEKLEADGYEALEGFVCPEAIRINKGRSIEQNPLFKEGFATVQDESAMLVAPSMDLKPNMTVLDLCSAPGGKATHASEIMENTGTVYAFDIHEDKLSLIQDNAKRLGITNLKCGVIDAAVYEEKLKDSADRVLIDVPCSGLGIIRKKPEIKWTKNIKQLNEIITVQRDIIKNASKYVKPGGILLYSTCTLNKQENEDNVKWFLQTFPNYSIEPLFFGETDNILYNNHGTTIFPNEYMDGFFIAKFKRLR